LTPLAWLFSADFKSFVACLRNCSSCFNSWVRDFSIFFSSTVSWRVGAVAEDIMCGIVREGGRRGRGMLDLSQIDGEPIFVGGGDE
jgi:hypothetical protein